MALIVYGKSKVGKLDFEKANAFDTHDGSWKHDIVRRKKSKGTSYVYKLCKE